MMPSVLISIEMCLIIGLGFPSSIPLRNYETCRFNR